MLEQNSTGNSASTVSVPELSRSLKPKRRAIRDAAQARRIITNLEQSSRERNLKNARIMAKYNAEKPYSQEELKAEGLGWKSNFTSKPLPMLIDKVAPRFSRAIESVKYLTNSSLPETFPNASEKTEAFRREITETVRAKPGWTNLIADTSMENALFGFTALCWLDEFTWFPKHFRQDQFFVPTGTQQQAASAQVIVLRETLLLHEIFSLVEDKEAADTAGWNLENTVNAINNAQPENRRNGDSNWERVYEDLIRESNVGMSHEAGALVVSVWHLLATEIDGKVSHYILTDNTVQPKAGDSDVITNENDVLFEREDRFEDMASCASFFAFQHGNGKLQGSKGIGRDIYGIAAIVDRARNEVLDRLNLSGKVWVKCDDKAMRRFKMSVVGNVVMIGQGYDIQTVKMETGVSEFLELDQFLTQLLDQMSGATTPKAFEGERVTKAAVDLFASREEESRDNIIGRFLTNFATMMSTLQRRMCSSDCSEKDAQEMQKRLLEVMSREELDHLAKSAVAETVKDYTETERQQIVMVASDARGNPLYNQRELERRKLSALISEEFAESVLLPEEDATVIAEQQRMQQLELLIIVGQAGEMPVSPRDNHIIHLQVMAPAMEAAATEAVAQGVQGLEVLQALAAHAEAHFAAAEVEGAAKDKLAETGKFLKGLRKAIGQLEELEQQQAAVEQAGPPMPGQPPVASEPPIL